MCMTCTATAAPMSQDAFAQKLLATVNNATTALMISIGHRTGLFDAMQSGRRYTTEELARATGLHERYVREWLGAMTTARITIYEPQEGRYHLPASHAAHLGRDAPEPMAHLFQFISVLGSVESRIVGCFVRGGGVPYEAFDRFHEVMAEESGTTVLPALIDGILPLDPDLPARLKAGIDVADLGCGSGRALALLARTYPGSRFTGIDLTAEAIARANANGQGLPNLRFLQDDAADWDEREAYDLILTLDAIHDQAHPGRVLKNIARALRPDGTYLMQDIDASSRLEKNMEHPLGPLLYGISTMHCMTVSLAQGGEGLGTMWGEEKARELLAAAGFGDVTVHRLPHDIQNAYWVCKK